MITEKDGLELLRKLEDYRALVNERRDYPRSDYPYRVCEAIVAKAAGFTFGRSEWMARLDAKPPRKNK